MSIVEIRRWPRWLRTTLLRHHPSSEFFGVERVLTAEDCISVCDTLTCCNERVGEQLDMAQKMHAAVAFRECLNKVPVDAAGILLTEGIDEIGGVYIAERILLVTLGSKRDQHEREGRRPTLPPPPYPPLACSPHSPPSPHETVQGQGFRKHDALCAEHEDKVASEPPSNDLQEEQPQRDAGQSVHMVHLAEQQAEDALVIPERALPIVRTESLSPIQSPPLADPLPPEKKHDVPPDLDDTPEWLVSPPPVRSPSAIQAAYPSASPDLADCTQIVHNGVVAVTLAGRIPPTLLVALATQRASLPVVASPPSRHRDGTPAGQRQLHLFRRGTQVRVGPYIVHPHSYEAGRYTSSALSTPPELLAPSRSVGYVTRRHQQRRREYERR